MSVDSRPEEAAPGSPAGGAAPQPSPALARAYWRRNLGLLAVLLAVWFTASFGLGILLVRPLNAFRLGGFPLGFWFAQQGSIYVFVVLIFVYARRMDRIEARLRGQSSEPR